MTITYSYRQDIDLEQFKALLIDSTLGERRPINDEKRLRSMLEHATLLISAWDDTKLVGLLRGFTDYAYVSYISDLAVANNYQSQGIGKTLLKKAQEKGGKGCKLVLLSAPKANKYYEKLGFTHHPRAWTLD